MGTVPIMDARRPPRLLTAAVGLALVTVGCGGTAPQRNVRRPVRCTAPARPPTVVAGTDPAVTRIVLTVADGRPSGCRLLPTEVRIAAGDRAPGPLLVVAHGLDGSPAALAPLLDSWARAGYSVAAPTFPVTAKDAGGNSLRSESADQAYDLRAVIDAVGSAARSPGNPLQGRIDASRVGAAGMSLGGLAVYALISNSCCRDERVDAAVVMAGVRRDFPDERYGPNDAPVMLLQGDADPGYHNSLEAYPELAPPKWFVTLHGSRHAPPFEVPNGPEAPFVRTVTRSFWDRYLRGDAPAASRILAAVAAQHGTVSLRHAG
jgi:dienelactone hydrolase